MKKILSLAALAVLISSCGNKMTLMKRHYTKGYYVEHKGSVDRTVSSHRSGKTSVNEMEPVAVGFSTTAKVQELTASLKVNAKQEASRNYNANLQQHIAVQKTALVSPVSRPGIQNEVSVQRMKGTFKRGGSSEGNLILLVILAIFPIFSLIAMYIHDGHKVTTNFWVNLLLHLTIIGYAIFGLLVVFNVVDLA
jgi:hypothetical protein